MTQDKELLLKDLCARLPYGVICHYDTIVPMVGKVKSYDKLRAISEFDNKPCFQFGCNRDIFDFDNVKPYLFPLSSIDDVIRGELVGIKVSVYESGIVESSPRLIDFYNKHHLDYRGLIKKGLAIDATGKGIY